MEHRIGSGSIQSPHSRASATVISSIPEAVINGKLFFGRVSFTNSIQKYRDHSNESRKIQAWPPSTFPSKCSLDYSKLQKSKGRGPQNPAPAQTPNCNTAPLNFSYTLQIYLLVLEAQERNGPKTKAPNPLTSTPLQDPKEPPIPDTPKDPKHHSNQSYKFQSTSLKALQTEAPKLGAGAACAAASAAAALSRIIVLFFKRGSRFVGGVCGR